MCVLDDRSKRPAAQVSAGKDDVRPADHHEQFVQSPCWIPRDEPKEIVSIRATCQTGNVFQRGKLMFHS